MLKERYSSDEGGIRVTMMEHFNLKILGLKFSIYLWAMREKVLHN